MERSCWLIRASAESRLTPTFEAATTVAVGWGDIPGVGDLTGLSRDAVVALLDGEAAAGADADQLLAFRDDVHAGDAVVAYGSPAVDLLVGEVTGTYEYRADPPAGGYAHARTVRWYARTDRDAAPAGLADDADTAADAQSLRPLTPVAEWLVLTDSLRAAVPAPVAAAPTPAASTPGAPAADEPMAIDPTTGKPPTKAALAKAAAAAKAMAATKAAAVRAAASLAAKMAAADARAAAAPPKKKAASRRGPVATEGGGVRPKGDPPVPATLCTGCGLQKAKSQFKAGSPYCVDCRDRRGED